MSESTTEQDDPNVEPLPVPDDVDNVEGQQGDEETDENYADEEPA